MAWSKLEDTYHDDPKFRRLSELLKLGDRIGEERGIVLAQGFVSRLWSWASRHAPDGYLLDSSVSTADIERICGWPTAGGRLVAGMVAANFLDQSADGAQVVRIIHRYWERAESHKAAQRKKKQREGAADVTGQSRPPPDPGHGNVSLRGEDREERTERRGDLASTETGSGAVGSGSDLLVDHAPIPPEAIPRAWAAYRAAREAKGKPAPLIASDLDKTHLRRLIGWTSPEEAPWVLRAWVSMDPPTKSLSTAGWPLAWLVKPDNLERARNEAVQMQDREAKKAARAAQVAAIDANHGI